MAKPTQLPELAELDDLLQEISSLSTSDLESGQAVVSKESTSTTNEEDPISSGMEATLDDINKLVDNFDKIGAAARRHLQKKPIPRPTHEKSIISGAAEGVASSFKIFFDILPFSVDGDLTKLLICFVVTMPQLLL
jgi:hypothetical protein